MAVAVLVNWDFPDDLNFSGTNDDITNDVVMARWKLGMRQPYQACCDEPSLTLKLKNGGGKYNPENASGVLYGKLKAGRPIQIKMSSTVMWRGQIEKIEVEEKPSGANTGTTFATIKAIGAKQQLQNQTMKLDTLTNTTADVLVSKALQQSPLLYALDSYIWILGIPAFSKLGTSTRLGGVTDYASLEVGRSVFAYAGDNELYSCWQLIQDATLSEQGRFFFGRDGKAVFWNRHHLLTLGAAAATVSPSGTYKYTDVGYEYGINMATIVSVNITQRAVGSSITLWSLDSAIVTPAGTTKEFWAYLKNAQGEFTGAQNLSASGTTFSSGTATITISSQGSRALVTIDNTAGGVDAVLSAMNIVGDQIESTQSITVEESDTTAIGQYGRIEHQINTALLSDENLARSIAKFELARRKDLRGYVLWIDLIGKHSSSDAHLISWGMGTAITVTLANGHSGDYAIMGEEHTWQKGDIHKVRYFLEPISGGFWQLGITGRSELGVNTRLAY